MSYNIDSVNYVDGTGPLRILRSAALKFFRKHEDDLPEITFLHDIDDGDGTDFVEISNPSWAGSGSGDEKLLRKALSLTTGRALIILVWEGGDSFSGLIVDAGVVTEGAVVQTVVPKVKK